MEGRRGAEGRSGWGPDVLPVGEECRGEDGREERGIERAALSSCHVCCRHNVHAVDRANKSVHKM